MSINHTAWAKTVCLLLKYTHLVPHPPQHRNANLSRAHFSARSRCSLHEHLLLYGPKQELASPAGRLLPSYGPFRASELPNQWFIHLYLWCILSPYQYKCTSLVWHILPTFHNSALPGLWCQKQIQLRPHLETTSAVKNRHSPLPKISEKSAELGHSAIFTVLPPHSPFPVWPDQHSATALLLVAVNKQLSFSARLQRCR